MLLVMTTRPATGVSPRDVLYAALVAEGPLSAMAQRAAAAYVRAYGGETVLSALSAALVNWGIIRRILPPQAGMRTAELVVVVDAAVRRLVDEYRDGGGVLLAKGWFSAEDVATAVSRLYWLGFSPPVPTTLRPKASDDEIAARRAVAAQAVARLLREWAAKDPPLVAYQPEVEELLSVALAQAALRAFLHPNETLHEALHGDPNAG